MKKNIYLVAACILYASTVSAQWSIDSLSAPYSGLGKTQNGSKAIFSSSTKYETYDFANGLWTIHNMPQPRQNVISATALDKSYFAGGGFIGTFSYAFYKNVDVYSANSDTWSTKNLSQARIVGGAAAVNNKVLFAGGRQILNYSKRVDIFDVNTGIRTLYNLSQPRTNMAVAVVGRKVIFSGGETGIISSGIYTESNKVDIYDDSTGTWTTALLSSKREQIAVAVVGTKVLFAGGIGLNGYSSRIDIYDASLNAWSTLDMSETKFGISAATSGDKVYLAGGSINNSGLLSNRVEIYDATTNTLSYVELSSPRMRMTVGQTPNRILFAGGIVSWGNVGTDRVEVLDLSTNSWSVEYLSQPRLNLASASYGNQAIFAGGAEVLSGYPQYSIISKRVDIWTDPALNFQAFGISKSVPLSLKSISIFPNPTEKNYINLDLSQFQNESVSIKIFSMTVELIKSFNINEQENSFLQLNISDLKSGVYLVKVEDESQIPYSLNFIVQH